MRLEHDVIMLWREENWQPTVGNLRRQRHVLRADGRQVDRQIGAAMQDALERFAQASGVVAPVGDLVAIAAEGQALLSGKNRDILL